MGGNQGISFGEFWPFLSQEARRRGLKQVEFMKAAGLRQQRYTDFNKSSRTLTTKYFIALCGALGLSLEEVVVRSGIKLSKEQAQAVKLESWISANRKVLTAIVNDPELSDEKKMIELVLLRLKKK